MVDNPQRAGQSGAVSGKSAGIRSVLCLVDIPPIAQDQNLVVAHTDPLILAAGFEVGGNLMANVPAGLHTAVFIGECFVESADTIRIKFGNNTINAVGPFNDTPIRFTQIPSP